MSLHNLQAELAEAIFANDQTTDLVTQPENIYIYHNNVITNLVNALKDTYPLLVRLLGEEFFVLTANEYIKNYPSRNSDLHEYGAYFSDFLSEYTPLHDLIYLAEVAQFEWLSHQLYFAADAPIFNIATLANIAPEQYEQLHFTLHPASALMKCHYPILQIIELCKGDIADNININAGGVNLLIIRRDIHISLVSLSEAEFTFLNALQENKSLAEALELTLNIDSDFNLQEKLLAWVQDKTIVACRNED